MEKNNIIELIKQISMAVGNAPKDEVKPTESAKPSSFKESVSAKTPSVEQPKKTNRTKKPAPSTDAIIKMIQTHNALSQKINSQNRTDNTPTK